MPFNQLQRRDSWPPTLIRLSNDPSTSSPPTPEQIDENPISFFLTVPNDHDQDFPSPDYDDLEDLSAGIEGSPESKSLPIIREVSPSSLQRSRFPLPEVEEELFDIDEDDYEDFSGECEIDGEEGDEEVVTFDVGMPLSLKDFTRRHHQALASSSRSPASSPIAISGRESLAGNRNASTRSAAETSSSIDHKLKGLGISIPDKHLSTYNNNRAATRGRAQIRLTPNVNPRGSSRGRTRSLSARRPQSWRVPSPDIYRIEEERDEAEDAVRARKNDHGEGNTDVEVGLGMGYSSSAPVVSAMAQARDGIGETKKVKKRVHWAF